MHEPSKPVVGGITVTEESDRTTVRLWGEIDEALRHDAGTALSRVLERTLPAVLDARRVDFIDSTGIAFLIQFCTVGREEGITVSLVEPSAAVTDVLDLLGLRHMFDAVPTVSAEQQGSDGLNP